MGLRMDEPLEAFRGRVYQIDETAAGRVIQIQCSWCWRIADDSEGYGLDEANVPRRFMRAREATFELRDRLRRAGWIVAACTDADDNKGVADASDYCSEGCADGVGLSAMEARLANVGR